MKNPTDPGEVVEAHLIELGLSVAEATKVIGETRQRLYIGNNSRSAAVPEMAVRFEKTFGAGASMWHSRRDRRLRGDRNLAQAARRSNKMKLLLGIGARLVAARQGSTDANSGMVAVTGTATRAVQLVRINIGA